MAEPDFSVKHVFMLMLENRSFDSLLGFSGISGRDADSGDTTVVNGAAGKSNSLDGTIYPAGTPAPSRMPVDPGHEFGDTLRQLTGQTAYPVNGSYPLIDCSGFVDDYVNSATANQGHATSGYGDIMLGFTKDQLPVLNALAREFAICDSWFSSMPGPTWPNRFFLHAASSGGLDHSPTTAEILVWQNIGGVNFKNGTIFEQLRRVSNNPYRIYRGDKFLSDTFPGVAALKDISALDCHPISDFPADVVGHYPWAYTFIEPSYGDMLNNTYFGGTSMHPMDNVSGGEALVKLVYETIRNSPLWPESLLIVTWDEHGGFYDHVAPPSAVPPAQHPANDTIHASMNAHGFDFRQYGVRVPAIICSPRISKNTIDHRLYDHSSVSKTLHQLFGTDLLTDRDAAANSLFPLLLMETTPRTDCITALPEPANESIAAIASAPALTANHGSLPGFLHAALQTDLKLSPEAEHPVIMREFASIGTAQDATDYMQKVQDKMPVA